VSGLTDCGLYVVQRKAGRDSAQWEIERDPLVSKEDADLTGLHIAGQRI